MTSPRDPDRATLQGWLDATSTEYYLCSHCEGLHIQRLQSLDGVVDSRLFQESYGLLLTTELEVRPMALLAVSADLGRFNMDYPTLKIFLDIVDDATPQLVAAGVMPTGGGITREQFVQFLTLTLTGVDRLAAECQELDYLFPGAEQSSPPPSTAVH
jgi:hypothetical protein